MIDVKIKKICVRKPSEFIYVLKFYDSIKRVNTISVGLKKCEELEKITGTAFQGF